MTSDFLERLDAAVESRCACPCRAPITSASPSAYFASELCSQRWHRPRRVPVTAFPRQQQAGDHAVGFDPADRDLTFHSSVVVERVGDHVHLRPGEDRRGMQMHYTVIDEMHLWQQVNRDWSAQVLRGVTAVVEAFGERVREAATRMARGNEDVSRYMARAIGQVAHVHVAAARVSVGREGGPQDMWERALWLRRNRNTGPRRAVPVPRRVDPAGGLRTVRRA